jgi:hypothetical protein
MAFDVQGFGTPDYGVSTVAGNPVKLDSGMTKLNEILDYQSKSLDLQKKQALQPYAIEAGKAESKKAVTESEKSALDLATEKMNKIRQAQVASITDPIVAKAAQDPEFAKNPETIKHMKGLIDQQAQVAIDSGIDPETVKQQIAPYHELADTQPQNVQQFLKNRLIAGLDTQAQAHLNSLQTVNGQPALVNPVQGTATGLSYPGVPQQGQQAPQVAPVQAQENYSQPEKVFYPTPVPGQVRPQLPSEEIDKTFGEKYRLGLKQLQQGYSAQKQNIDNLYDKANQMIGSNPFSDTALGTGLRKLESSAGSPEYQQLEKMLARVQLGQMSQEQQANTDMGRQMTAVANGQSHIDPKIIVDLTRQNAANLERSNSQAIAAERAGQLHGDANLTRKFATEWNKNSDDNRIFEIKYIFNHAKTPEEGAKEVSEFIKSQPENKRKELATKYLNLKKLEETGSL